MLDFRTETFLCVCEEMNYTKAAKRLHITQPAVSQHIKYLEQYYGTVLFSFSGKQMLITEAGKQLKSALLAVKHDETHLRHVMESANQQEKKMTFGATLTIGEFVMPEKIVRFTREHPEIEVEMIVDNTARLLHLLDNGEIEFAVIEGFYPKNEYESISISEEKFVAVGSPSLELSGIKQFSDLFCYRLFLREPGSGSREILVRYMQAHGYRLEDFFMRSTISSIGSLKQMLEQGEGISFLYKVAVERELKEERLKEIKIPRFSLEHNFDFVWRKGSIFRKYYETKFKNLF